MIKILHCLMFAVFFPLGFAADVLLSDQLLTEVLTPSLLNVD